MSKSKVPLMLLIVLVVGGVIYGAIRLKATSEVSGRAAEEAKAEAAELKECQDHLALFYKAWKQYKADNKGAAPPSMAAMIPKYIPDPSVLVCPTAARLDKTGMHLDRGSFKIDGKSIDMTYGFRWMAAGFSKQVQKQGDKIPLVVCECHRQAMYQVAYNKVMRGSTFDDEERAKLVPEVAKAPVLVVRMNGQVETLDAAADH